MFAKNKAIFINDRFWIAGLIVFKFLVFGIYVFCFNANFPAEDVTKWISYGNADTRDYYEPIERFVSGEGYSLNRTLDGDLIPRVLPWSYRMPGLLPIYAPLYMLLDVEWARFMVILLQFGMEILSIVLLARTTSLVFGKKNLFYVCLILYGINAFVSVYTVYATAESFCVSFFIVSLYYLMTYIRKSNKNSDLILSGLFFCWAIFFRPATVFFLPSLIFLILYHHYVNGCSVRTILKKALLFILVFVVVDCAWIARNYLVFNEFAPLNGSFEQVTTKREIALYQLIISWGGDIQNWNPSEGRWFIRPSASKTRVYDPEFQKGNPFRSFIFTSKYNLDSLQRLRSLYWRAFESESDSVRFNAANSTFIEKAHEYQIAFKTEKPFYYYVVSKFLHLKTFLFIVRPYGLPFIRNDIINKLLRVAGLLVYYLILIGSFVGVVLSFKNRVRYGSILSFTFILYVLVHVFFGFTEFRYVLPAYPIMAMFASFAFLELLRVNQNRKNKLKTNEI